MPVFLSALVLENVLLSDVLELTIDGCIISSPSNPKCDYGLVVESTKVFYLIELKGQNWNKALSQLINTFSNPDIVSIRKLGGKEKLVSKVIFIVCANKFPLSGKNAKAVSAYSKLRRLGEILQAKSKNPIKIS